MKNILFTFFWLVSFSVFAANEHLTRSDSAVLVTVSSPPESKQNPAFSPDGNSIIYTLFHNGYNKGPAGIYTCCDASGGSVALIDEADQDAVNLPGTSYNPNTNRITFASDRNGTEDIWTMNQEGSDLKQITHHPKGLFYLEPSFSPDGQWIVFEADNNKPEESQQGSVYKVRIDGSDLTQLTNGLASGTDDRQPNWSPTGEVILFQRRLPGSEDWDIYTINPEGGALKQVTTTTASDTDASFSPDGKWIVYSSDHGGLELPSIFIIPASGGAPVQVTMGSTYEDAAPSWSPDGKSIAFESQLGESDYTPASIWRIAAPLPIALITVNGESKVVDIAANEAVIMSVSLNPATFINNPADWWLIHIDPKGSASYFELNAMTFKSGTSTSLQTELFPFNSFILPPTSFAKQGTHNIYFGIDLNQNGNIDFSTAYYDSVTINVNEDPSNLTSAKSVYNQAYQENFAEDKIADIIQQAQNAYVLIDPFNSGIVEKIPEIRKNNNEIGCYISIGTGEDWRDDFAQIQPYLVKKQWGDWPGEYFVNQTNTGILEIMQARIDKMTQWGCNWVEFDNMDWAEDDQYRKQYSFQVSLTEARAYYQALCDYVHQQGMKCMAKNTVEKAADFDGALYESSHTEKNWWDTDGTWSFLNAQKLVIINHYNESDCDKIYKDYQQFYNDTISFICEDIKVKGYVHY